MPDANFNHISYLLSVHYSLLSKTSIFPEDTKMNIYKVSPIEELLSGNPYPGRGIMIGQTADGTKAAFAYFIMGRSENSRNRIFSLEGKDLRTLPFGEGRTMSN